MSFSIEGDFFLELLYGIRIFPKVLIVFAGSWPAHRVDIVPLGTIEAQGCARWAEFGPHPMGKRDSQQRQAVVVCKIKYYLGQFFLDQIMRYNT